MHIPSYFIDPKYKRDARLAPRPNNLRDIHIVHTTRGVINVDENRSLEWLTCPAKYDLSRILCAYFTTQHHTHALYRQFAAQFPIKFNWTSLPNRSRALFHLTNGANFIGFRYAHHPKTTRARCVHLIAAKFVAICAFADWFMIKF